MGISNGESRQLEIHIIGSTLKISTAFEGGLMNIIYFSNAEQYKISNAPSLKIKNLMFSKKVERAQDLLAEHHPDLLAVYCTMFDKLAKFKELRNRIAHCQISWPDESLCRLEIWDITEDETKFQFYVPIPYTVNEIMQFLIWAGKEITPDLRSLQEKLERRLESADSRLYAQLISAAHNEGQAML